MSELFWQTKPINKRLERQFSAFSFSRVHHRLIESCHCHEMWREKPRTTFLFSLFRNNNTHEYHYSDIDVFFFFSSGLYFFSFLVCKASTNALRLNTRAITKSRIYVRPCVCNVYRIMWKWTVMERHQKRTPHHAIVRLSHYVLYIYTCAHWFAFVEWIEKISAATISIAMISYLHINKNGVKHNSQKIEWIKKKWTKVWTCSL